MKRLILAGLALFLSGCAPKKPVHNQVSGYYWDRSCLISVHLSNKTYCDSPDGKNLSCYFLKMERVPHCESVKVSPALK